MGKIVSLINLKIRFNLEKKIKKSKILNGYKNTIL